MRNSPNLKESGTKGMCGGCGGGHKELTVEVAIVDKAEKAGDRKGAGGCGNSH